MWHLVFSFLASATCVMSVVACWRGRVSRGLTLLILTLLFSLTGQVERLQPTSCTPSTTYHQAPASGVVTF